MVSDILIFSERQHTDAEIKPGDYRAFILGLIGDLRAEAELKDAQIEMPGEPPALMVAFEPRRLSRVFYNLVHNATDVMLNGGKIFLRFHHDEKEIITEIEDTGPGLAPEVVDKLFRAFVTFGKSQGTGLGLSICKKIIGDHHGRIWARSEAGRGAIFSFALPLAK
jgi:signal transduction histidine kinase